MSVQSHQPEPKDLNYQPEPEALAIDPHPVSLDDKGERSGSREEHLEDRIHQVLEQKLVSLLDNESANREIIWLRRQVNWSIGFLAVLILIFGGAFTWFAYLMRTNPPTIQADSSTAIAPFDAERLEAQIQTLSEQIPDDFPATLTANQEQLQMLSEQLNTLSNGITKNQQTLVNLESSIQALEESLLLKVGGTVGPSTLEHSSESE
ncbi:MAG: hypothetical protein AAF289_03895 [Cyanobacteria bacterium P01_A01_bin.135]